MKSRYLLWLCVLFVGLNLLYTLAQYAFMPIDGDLCGIALPTASYVPVLHDPFGWAALTRHEVYAAPNRFFAHVTLSGYFKLAPLALQTIISPINSIYAASALFSTITQALLLYVLAVYSSGTGQVRNVRLWLAMTLLTPLFQAHGYVEEMGIIPPSVSYSFFYPWPALLLLVWLLPFYRWAKGQPWQLSAVGVVASAALAVVLAFNGPIIPGTVAVLGLGIGVHWLLQTSGQPWRERLRAVPVVPVVLLAWLGLLCAYSLYIGSYNAENSWSSVSLGERYRLLPLGLKKELTDEAGMPLLVLLCLVNAFILRRWVAPTPESHRIRIALRWVGLFALVYILLLPLGGYRSYRPYLLRFDSVLPITLGLVFFYALSACYLLYQLPLRARAWYASALLVVTIFYTKADRRLKRDDGNACERAALAELANAPANIPVVQVKQECNVLSWQLITNPAASANNAAMLDYWHVTRGPKQYFH